ncbi:Hypothetical protein Ccan_17540 [Capnocytophaga canimorsus Cc5]|uniref:Uncharacterized protein n=1 Tax=Capnocytophaga canimorsus (strain 5) TaxID=860228 RepID=F9YSE5_CAPCC|nr:Hypothetical protein Ccan_17540 [Capnocytophaga canimorsus Cc5]
MDGCLRGVRFVFCLMLFKIFKVKIFNYHFFYRNLASLFGKSIG